MRSDPIGLYGGINLYSYVSNNPVNAIDPLGNIEWNGTVRGGSLFTAGVYVFNLTSECVNGKQATVKVVFVGVGLGLGLDVSATKSDVTLNDPFLFINTQAFNNNSFESFIAQAGASWPPTAEQKLGQIIAGQPDLAHGAGYSAIQLGHAGGVGSSDLYGFQVNIEALLGTSTVWDVEMKDCCDE